MTRQTTLSIAVFVLFFLVCAPLIHAQPLSQETKTLSIVVTPQYYEPHTTVVVRAEGDDITRSEIVWFANGARLEETGRTASITLGRLGTETPLEVVRITPDGSETREGVILRPTEVDILWAADSYTPPFFRGRPLPTPGTTLIVEALARFKRKDGTFIPKKDLVYTWRMGNTVFGNVSGRGNNIARIPSPLTLETSTLSVEVRSIDGAMGGRAATRVSSHTVTPVLYHDHPLFGVLRNAAIPESVVFSDTEATLAILPYYAKTRTAVSPDLEYSWSVNGDVLETGESNANKIIVRTDGGSGLAHIELTLRNIASVMQDVRKAWKIFLETEPKNGFFDQ